MRRSGDGQKATSSKRIDNPESDEDTSPPVAKRKCTKPRQTPLPQNEISTMQQLEEALQQTNPDKRFIKKAMKETFSTRRKWMLQETPPVSIILEKFPIFKTQKYVSACPISSYIFMNVK